MSFDCDNCGKNAVEKFGSWCSECQQEEDFRSREAEALWFRSVALCMQCGNCWGPDPSDKCEAYNMPLSMVGRKRKCKKFYEMIF